MKFIPREPREARDLPADIYVPLVDSLYKEGRTLLVGSIFVVGSVLATYWKTGEPLLLACAAALALVACVRGLFMHAYTKVKPAIQTNSQARKWEYGYVAGATTSVALLGAWCFIAFSQTSDPFAHLISFSMTIAYVIGVFGRNFGSPKFVMMQIICAWIPMTAALLLYGDAYHWFFAVLLVPFFMAVKFISDRLRTTLLDAIVATRDISGLAMRFDAALSNMPHGICMFDHTGCILVANKRMGQILDLPSSLDVKGWPARRLVRSCLKAGTIGVKDAKRIVRNIVTRRPGVTNELIVETRNARTLAITFQPMDNGGVVALLQDITERKQAENTIKRMARFDALTELPNRNLLHQRLEDAFANEGRPEACAVHFIDLDHFKQVNDTLGHSRGDFLLQAVAKRLCAILRSNDMAARFGGDEFVVLQIPVESPAEVSALAGRIVKELSRPYIIDGHEIVIGASIGVAMLPRDGSNIEQLLKNADMALYRAKADNHRGTWRFFKPEMDVQAQARRNLEMDLRNAIERDEFEVHYQPIIDLKSGEVTTFEALLRWPHPERGLVSAKDFISIAEETGAIVELGNRVLRSACEECVNWPEHINVAVNMSPLQFTRSDVPEIVRQTLSETGLSAHRLEIEITESALLQITSGTRAALQTLQLLGVKISLDDFGTGYSSLSYLHSFPLHKVKIDRSFIQDIDVRKRSLTLLHGVTRLSAELGLRVTVEGIETRDQLALITRDGYVHEGQGFLFGKPVSANAIPKLLYGFPQSMEQVA